MYYSFNHHVNVLTDCKIQMITLYNYRLLVRSKRVLVDLIKVISPEYVVWGLYHFYQVDKNTYPLNLKGDHSFSIKINYLKENL